MKYALNLVLTKKIICIVAYLNFFVKVETIIYANFIETIKSNLSRYITLMNAFKSVLFFFKYFFF